MKRFYVGLHIIKDADHFDYSFVSVNTLYKRKSHFPVNSWVMDSGAFTEITKYGEYRSSVTRYADEIKRWSTCGNLQAAVTQDWMCEPFVLRKTGLTVIEHQRRTIDRYDALMDQSLPVYLMPVLQGFYASEYLRHLEMYGDRIAKGAWVGIGSVCKRNSNPQTIASLLAVIRNERPDIRLHGFGVKVSSLYHPGVREMLFSSDSMAWSFAARKEGRDQNSWQEAKRFESKVHSILARPSRSWEQPLWLIPEDAR